MQRINSTDGFFHDGNPATGALGTFLAALWHNAVQEELIAPITAAGLTLDPNNNGQLLAAILALIESKTGNYGLDTGAVNSYVTALTPAVTAYVNGLQVKFRAAHSNTGQSTLNAGAGVVPLLRDDGTPLQAGDVPANAIVGATYDAAAAAFLLNSIVASQFDTIMQAGTPLYSVDTGAANVYKAAYAPTVTALTDGMKLRFRAKTANTGASTFAPDGIAAAPIWGADHVALAGGEIVVNGEIEVQWNAALSNGNGAWVLCENTGGYQRGPTPPQFDNSTKLATTAFLKGVGVQFGGVVALSAATTLDVTYAGKLIIPYAATGAFAITLPLASTFQPGATLSFLNGTVYPITILKNGSDTVSTGNTSLSSFVLNPGDTLDLACNGTSNWQAWGGSAGLQYAGVFGSSLSTSGYQKLPSGLIFQWTNGASDANGNMVVTNPIAFQTAPLGGLAGEGAPGGWMTGTATVWAFDISSSSKTASFARVRNVSSSGPGVSSGIAGRVLVWGY
ncbi:MULTISPECIES: gp53-like domain-containing protein [Burkholderia]|uniref:gp53-like domain-containing protein n=1 Tax=Burkholderia TaxID=32008 RepID=UPI00068BD731|nr:MULTISPECIES: hypothetical protein [Burkholderia]TCT31962.1 hypothetical protein EC918_102190 [Burkholderia vietnamiensis]SCZ28131.1 hypothetical protein SAMN02787148_106246 [Burkholderia vietnamiensis]SFX62872.1 hypothetical protein SAMN02787160_106247 [Burkholderia vietnamiensis]